jgi:hypothetical protein
MDPKSATPLLGPMLQERMSGEAVPEQWRIGTLAPWAG